MSKSFPLLPKSDLSSRASQNISTWTKKVFFWYINNECFCGVVDLWNLFRSIADWEHCLKLIDRSKNLLYDFVEQKSAVKLTITLLVHWFLYNVIMYIILYISYILYVLHILYILYNIHKYIYIHIYIQTLC